MTDLNFSPTRFAVLRPETLGRMAVLESISFEDILAARMDRFRAVWASADPPNAAQYDVDSLEFDPIKIVEECNAYFEVMLRDRVNQAARAVTLVFGFGSNLDAIASRYPGGVPRLDGESDDRYRRRIWASPNSLSPHGVAEGYEFFALTSMPSLRDVRTVKTRISLTENPVISIVCLADSGGAWTTTTGITTLAATRVSAPVPSSLDLLATRKYILDESRMAMTDEISVTGPKILQSDYYVQIELFPGVVQQQVMTDVMTSLQTLIETQRWLGFDHMRSSISQASMVSGVHNAVVVLPATDLRVDNDWFAQVDNITVEFVGIAE